MAVRERANGLPEFVSLALKIGAGTALSLILLGLVLASVHGSYVPGKTPVIPVSQLLHSGQIGSPLWVLNLGLLALMLTPVLGLLAAVTGLALERDWRYLLVTLAVLAVIYISTLVSN